MLPWQLIIQTIHGWQLL